MDDEERQCLPNTCEYSENELRIRMASGIEPDSAEEYLARVKVEAKGLPVVKEADKKEIGDRLSGWAQSSFTVPSPIAPIAEGTAPSNEWRKSVLNDFVNMRLYMSRWKARGICSQLPTVTVPKKSNMEEWEKLRLDGPPMVHFILSIDQKSSGRVLKDMSETIAMNFEEDETFLLGPDWSLWLYSFLSVFEKPLSVGTEANLRALLRTLCKIRARITSSLTYLPSILNKHVAGLDILICILEDYFKV